MNSRPTKKIAATRKYMLRSPSMSIRPKSRPRGTEVMPSSPPVKPGVCSAKK